MVNKINEVPTCTDVMFQQVDEKEVMKICVQFSAMII